MEEIIKKRDRIVKKVVNARNLRHTRNWMLLILVLLFASCKQVKSEMVRQERFAREVNAYLVLDKSEGVGSHYKWCYRRMGVRTEYNVILRQTKTHKVYVLKDVPMNLYYRLEKGKTYKFSNGDMMYVYSVKL